VNLDLIPVVLFVYQRPGHLRRTLECLRKNTIPLLIVYCDGLKDPGDEERLNDTRNIAKRIDWCPVRIIERERNLGLGVSIRTGVSEVLQEFGAAIIFEDDIDCVPGTYDYMAAALRHYENDPRVMSVTGFVHPDVRPPVPADQPYFDGRFTCWGWGTWARAWQGMDTPAVELLRQCKRKGIDVNRYGIDMVIWAKNEKKQNIWAVRFGLLHFLRGGLNYHPPHSLTNHAGFDQSTTSSGYPDAWQVPVLQPCPLLPNPWPEPIEHRDSPGLYREKCGTYVSLPGRVKAIFMVVRWRLGAVVRRGLKRFGILK
jgi:hypothetical protein